MLKIKIIYILISTILAGLLVYAGYFFGLQKEKISQCVINQLTVANLQELGAGEVGEVMVKDEKTGEESPLISPTMPPAIFSTAGTITEINSDKIVLRGDGSNFADGVPRTITAILTAETITFSKNQTVRYLGEEGLKQLKAGMEVLIDSQENIRGKTEFEVKTINIL